MSDQRSIERVLCPKCESEHIESLGCHAYECHGCGNHFRHEPLSSNPSNCGHLRIFHVSMDVYEERQGECMFCQIERLTAERDAEVYHHGETNHTLREVVAERDRLKAELKRHAPVSHYNGRDIESWMREAQRLQRIVNTDDAAIEEVQADNARLKHDIERHLEHLSNYATELCAAQDTEARLRAALKAALPVIEEYAALHLQAREALSTDTRPVDSTDGRLADKLADIPPVDSRTGTEINRTADETSAANSRHVEGTGQYWHECPHGAGYTNSVDGPCPVCWPRAGVNGSESL